MDSNQINIWLSVNVEKFNSADLPAIKAVLEQMDNNQLMFLQNADFKKPSTIFLIAFFLGWERFFLNDVGLGIVKVITGYGCGIWWLIDIFSAKARARKYNFKQFQKVTSPNFGALQW
jgi:TM2 domain-containing membrane protein YozV